MKQEYSAGVVVYHKEKKQIEFLLLHYESGHWDFAKGHIEGDESLQETALRELKEETGLTVEIQPGFQEEFTYFFRTSKTKELIRKKVYFFIGQVLDTKVVLSSEHIGYMWLPYEEALERLTFQNARDLLKKVHEYLSGS